MAKGYSVRRARNYTRNNKGEWKLHSIGCLDDKGHTLQFPTVEAAEQFARNKMEAQTVKADEDGYIQYCKIYCGNQYIKTVNR